MHVHENRPDGSGGQSSAYWTCQVLGWGGYGVGYYLAVLVPFRAAGPKQAAADLAYCVAGLLGTHLLRSRIKLHGWNEIPYRALIPRLLAGALLVGALQVLALDGALMLGNQFDWNRTGQGAAVFGVTVFFSALLIGLWLAIYLGVQASRRRRTAELDALRAQVLIREARLRFLQQQLNPHFLFNCLNGLRGMIDEDSRRAQVMVTRLAELLRSSLRQDEHSVVSLAEELSTVSAYLELESMRFEERLRIRRDLDPQALPALVPPMLLQGLVENAIKHGIAQLPCGGELDIRIRRNGEQLRVDICNTGTLRNQDGTGIGLANARERLRLLYGKHAELSLTEDPAGWVHATLVLPFQNVEVLCEQSS
jgi:signal transduction histidine kinase